MSKTWFVTGSARGLGRCIVETALDKGDRVFATARDAEHLADLQGRFGDRVALGALDVTDAGAAREMVGRAISHFGELDVLVNNAGFARIAPFEQMPDTVFAEQIDANFHGVVHLTRAVLPHMRERRSGHIINISSGAGRLGVPGMSAYHAAKFAVGGFTEAVAQEIASFGVKMIAVEPGSMPTNWARRASADVPELLPEYRAVIGHIAERTSHTAGHEIGDLAKYAGVIFDLSRRESLPLRLLLGSDALFFVRMAEDARHAAGVEWEAVSRSTDRDGADISSMIGA